MKTIIFTYLASTMFVVGCNTNNSKIETFRFQNDSLKNLTDSLRKINDSLVKKIDFYEMIDEFGVNIIQLGGLGSHQVQLQGFFTKEHGYWDADKFVSYFFNNSGGLWVYAKAGYKIKSATSVGQCEISYEEDRSGVYFNLFLNPRNDFTIILEKEKDYNKYLKDKAYEDKVEKEMVEYKKKEAEAKLKNK